MPVGAVDTMSVFDWTVAEIGAVVTDPHEPWFARGDRLIQVSHEPGLRRGTFIGLATDRAFLKARQCWGRRYLPDAGDLPTTDRPVAESDQPLTVDRLTRRHLSHVSRRDVAVEGVDIHPADRCLIAVDHRLDRVNGDGEPVVRVVLTFGRAGYQVTRQTILVEPPLDARVEFIETLHVYGAPCWGPA